MIHRDNRSKQRHDERYEAVQELKAAGWTQNSFGYWCGPNQKYAYPTKQAIERMRAAKGQSK